MASTFTIALKLLGGGAKFGLAGSQALLSVGTGTAAGTAAGTASSSAAAVVGTTSSSVIASAAAGMSKILSMVKNVGNPVVILGTVVTYALVTGDFDTFNPVSIMQTAKATLGGALQVFVKVMHRLVSPTKSRPQALPAPTPRRVSPRRNQTKGPAPSVATKPAGLTTHFSPQERAEFVRFLQQRQCSANGAHKILDVLSRTLLQYQVDAVDKLARAYPRHGKLTRDEFRNMLFGRKGKAWKKFHSVLSEVTGTDHIKQVCDSAFAELKADAKKDADLFGGFLQKNDLVQLFEIRKGSLKE